MCKARLQSLMAARINKDKTMCKARLQSMAARNRMDTCFRGRKTQTLVKDKTTCKALCRNLEARSTCHVQRWTTRFAPT